MANNGRWEGRIKIPTGGWSFDVTETGGGGATDTISLTAANTYYHSSPGNDTVDFPAKLQALLNAATLNATYTVTVSATATGTGKYTISATGGSVTAIAIAFTSTDFRNLIGFTGNVNSALSHTGANHARALWIPQCPVNAAYHLDSDGMPVYDRSHTLSPTGVYKSLVYGSHNACAYEYQYVLQAKTITAAEDTTNESYQTFWVDCIAGDGAWAEPGKALRWYQDASTDGTYKTLNALGGPSPDYARVDNTWDGAWRVLIECALNV